MVAMILSLSQPAGSMRALRACDRPSLVRRFEPGQAATKLASELANGLASELAGELDRVRTWRGASGQRYAHTVFRLLECPQLPRATYMLVERRDAGVRVVRHIGIATDHCPSLNLARIRQRGAELGINEVHVHLLAATDEARALVAYDLRAALFGSLSAGPVSPAEPRDPSVASRDDRHSRRH